jgi:glycosyltransferase involved in cell wall biosynthesis
VTQTVVDDSSLVSIIIPAFNAGRFLAATLDSCLIQSYPQIEVIVVDDGSNDDTALVADAYCLSDSRVSCLRQPNLGQCAARNLGLAAAKGQWVWFLDSDDLLFPWSVEQLLGLARVSCTQMAIGQERGLQEATFEEEYREILKEGPAKNINRDAFRTVWEAAKHGGYSFNSVLCLTKFIKAAGGFDEQLRAGEEFNLNCRLTARCDDVSVAKSGNLSVVAKRFRMDSLAITSRHRLSPPWALLSAAASLRVVTEASKDGLDAMRCEIRDNVYVSAIYAYRGGHKNQALENLVRISASQIMKRVTPRWHAVLHVLFGFRAAEGLLMGLRSFRGITVRRSGL